MSEVNSKKGVFILLDLFINNRIALVEELHVVIFEVFISCFCLRVRHRVMVISMGPYS